MELVSRKWFSFKCALYSVANNLTSHDVDHIKFLLTDTFPRQELEKARNGFGLLCLLCTRKELLSPNCYSFLDELLREVGKTEFLKEISDTSTPSHFASIVIDADDSTSLKFKEFLDFLAEELTSDNVQTLSLFFVDVCESISYASAVALSSAKDLFSKLQEGRIIGMNHLQSLHKPLGLIGRMDLVAVLEQFGSGLWQSRDYLKQ